MRRMNGRAWVGASAVAMVSMTTMVAMVARPAAAAVYEVGPGDDVEGTINAAVPGDEIVLADGEYVLTERFSFDIAGTEAMPIVIRAADGAQPHLHRPDAMQNIVDIDGAAWVEIRGIEFSGGSAGIRIGAADHLTIEDCDVHDTEDVAIRANDNGVTYESLHIIHNHVHHTGGTGEGMYLGCNEDGCRLSNGLIERNYVHHTNGPTVSQGDGIELKEGSHDTVIRDNVIHDTNYPCILTYSAVGNGGPNLIERNVMWSCGDHGIQSAADATIRNNIILWASSDGLAMQQHQNGAPQNLTVVHNTIVQETNDAISLRNTVGAVTIANNALYAQAGMAVFLGPGDTSMLTLVGNVGVGGVSGGMGGVSAGDLAADLVDGHYAGVPPIDVFPAMGGALVGTGDPAYVVDDDFNTTPRGGVADVGAYAYDPAGNPGWPLAEEFKEFPDDGGGTGGDTGGDTTGDETGDVGSDGLDGSGMDTGPGGSGTSGGGTGQGSGSGGSAGAGDGDGDGGCGCRTRGRGGEVGGLVLLLLFGARRRRRT